MQVGDGVILDKREQFTGLADLSPAMRKYIMALRVYAAWLPYEVAPITLVLPPKSLYSKLREIGFVWATRPLGNRGDAHYWRPHKTRKIKSYEELSGC